MLVEYIKKNQSELLALWQDKIMSSYPADSVSFLKNERDRFNNPVGYNIRESTAEILEGLLSGSDIFELNEAVDNLVRIRSVQDFSPSLAVAFLSDFREVLREKCAGFLKDNKCIDEFIEFEKRIDKLMLMAFEVYTNCREQIYNIRINEIKNQSAILFERSQNKYNKEL